MKLQDFESCNLHAKYLFYNSTLLCFSTYNNTYLTTCVYYLLGGEYNTICITRVY